MNFTIYEYFFPIPWVSAHLLSHIWFCDSLDLASLKPWPSQDSSVHGILQARILEWVAIPSSKGSSRSRDRNHRSCVSCTAVDPLLLSHWGSPVAQEYSCSLSFPFVFITGLYMSKLRKTTFKIESERQIYIRKFIHESFMKDISILSRRRQYISFKIEKMVYTNHDSRSQILVLNGCSI